MINITSQVKECVRQSGIREELALVNAMHITASVFINDDESGLHQDFERWLEGLAPHEPVTRYRHNRTGEDNAEAHLKRQVMGREVVVAVTDGRLDLGPWEQIFYGEFDGRRRKRVLVKIIGEQGDHKGHLALSEKGEPMGVSIAFLRRRSDGAWEGDYTSVGRATFGEFQDLIFSQPGTFLLPAFREGAYDIEWGEGPPPYPAQVMPELAKDLESWLHYEAPHLLKTLQQIPPEQVEEYVLPLKALVEKRLAEGYAIMVSY